MRSRVPGSSAAQSTKEASHADDVQGVQLLPHDHPVKPAQRGFKGPGGLLVQLGAAILVAVGAATWAVMRLVPTPLNLLDGAALQAVLGVGDIPVATTAEAHAALVKVCTGG